MEVVGDMISETVRRLGISAAVALAISVCLSCAASAQQDRLLEYTGLSCDEWLRNDPLFEQQLRDWVLRFVAIQHLSGGYRVNIVDSTPSDQLLAWIDKHCRTRPLDGLAVAATELVNDMAARAAASK